MTGVRRIVGIVAILAIALHGLLLGLAPLAATAAADPFSVICHSAVHAPAGDEQAPARPDIGALGCEHCNLCNAAAAPPAIDDVFAGQLLPTRVLALLQPVATSAANTLTTTPKLAQGPPAFA
jgi:hypothetical protein